MQDNTVAAAQKAKRSERVIVHHKKDDTGPVIIAIAGMHGNENYGVTALRKIDELLEKGGGISSGEWMGIAANIGALKERVRFIDEDMNRIWFPSIVDKIRRSAGSQLSSNERLEIKNILEIIDPYLESGRKLIFIDLHSFSALGGLFVISPRNKKTDEILGNLTVPLIFGIDERLQGTALRYLDDLGHIAFAFEGGNHHDPGTLVNMVAYLLLLSRRCGIIDAAYIDEFAGYHQKISIEAEKLPARVELVYQHIIEPEDRFVMRPGFENFQPVEEGQWLADDQNGRITSPADGYILMPLYQEQGNDGFFIVREI